MYGIIHTERSDKMKDCLVQGIVNEGRIRVIVCTSTELVKKAKESHDLWSTSCIALGRTLTIGAMMGAMLKDEREKITIQINGGGSIGQILVDAYADGRVRGFVNDPHISLKYNESGLDAVAMAVGKEGYLRVIRDTNLKSDFTGTVELVSGEIGDDFAFYFTASEQVPTAVSVGVQLSAEEEVKVAGGIIIQMMPDATESDIQLAENALKNCPSITNVIQQKESAEEVLLKFFPDAEVIASKEVRFECDCSKEKMAGALSVVDKKDLQEMIEEDHGCEIICNYCSTKYIFNEEELQEILDHGKMAH